MNRRNGRNTTYSLYKTASTNLQSQPKPKKQNKIRLKLSHKTEFNDIEELTIIQNKLTHDSVTRNEVMPVLINIMRNCHDSTVEIKKFFNQYE